MSAALAFELPRRLEATEPPPERDRVRMLVASRAGIRHASFLDLPELLEPGSAEMPSAGRPFSERVLERLEERGITVATIVLHTGVSSLERCERPYPERFRVPAGTLAAVRDAQRVIAVGTTVVRALETAAGGVTEGWTRLVVEPERGVRVVDGILTGWHEPDASHLLMLEAIAGRPLVERSYEAALADGYRWHEFGDSHLLLAS
jgi:S-adenosylmethionine:tRNA ribosyltransferase-isomerase